MLKTSVYHCHIIDHHAAGMMANFEVIDSLQPARKNRNRSLDAIVIKIR